MTGSISIMIVCVCQPELPVPACPPHRLAPGNLRGHFEASGRDGSPKVSPDPYRCSKLHARLTVCEGPHGGPSARGSDDPSGSPDVSGSLRGGRALLASFTSGQSSRSRSQQPLSPAAAEIEVTSRASAFTAAQRPPSMLMRKG